MGSGLPAVTWTHQHPCRCTGRVTPTWTAVEEGGCYVCKVPRIAPSSQSMRFGQFTSLEASGSWPVPVQTPGGCMKQHNPDSTLATSHPISSPPHSSVSLLDGHESRCLRVLWEGSMTCRVWKHFVSPRGLPAGRQEIWSQRLCHFDSERKTSVGPGAELGQRKVHL